MDELKWDKISIESLIHGLDQGEKMLKETLETAVFQVGRSLTVLKSSLGIFIILFGYVISSEPKLSYIYAESILGLLVMGWIIRSSFNVYKTYQVKPIGNSPSNILRRENIKYAGKKLDQFLLFNCCRTVEDSIEFNQTHNAVRAKKLKLLEKEIKIGLIIVISFPFLLFLCSLFVPVLQGLGS